MASYQAAEGPNADLIKRFYTAFQNRDSDGMAACYHKDVTFYDPMFQELKGDEARAMWAMLCERGKDLEIEFQILRVDGDRVWAHWDARYTFTRTGRKVLNRIDAQFRIQDGLIIDHIDTFDLWAWEIQAIGFLGRLCGCCGFFQTKLRSQSRQALVSYMQKKGLAE